MYPGDITAAWGGEGKCVPTEPVPMEPSRTVQGVRSSYSWAIFLVEPVSLRVVTEYFFLIMIVLIANQYNLDTNLWNSVEFPESLLMSVSRDSPRNPGKERARKHVLVASHFLVEVTKVV